MLIFLYFLILWDYGEMPGLKKNPQATIYKYTLLFIII